jgi:hypothetical protein
MRLPRVKHLFFLRYPPHPSRRWRRVGCHCSSPEALPRNVCLSHPSQKVRRMGHPVFITLGEPQAHGDTLGPWLDRNGPGHLHLISDPCVGFL